jgi:hypothetical protein
MILNSTKFGGNRTKDVEVGTLVVYPGQSSFPRIMSLKVVFQICFGSIKMMGTRGVLVPHSGQLSYSIYVSLQDLIHLIFEIKEKVIKIEIAY